MSLREDNSMAKPASRFRAIVIVVIVLALAFLALQFVGPKVTNPPVTADLVAPDDVKAVLKTSCYNCHSNETHLWWYDKIAPASWLGPPAAQPRAGHI